jgi:hypothetical protein
MADETLNLRDLLEVPLTNFPDRPNLPAGKTFYGKLVTIVAGSSEQKETPYYGFEIRLTDPGNDVPQAAMKALSDAGFSLADYNCGARFYLTKGSMIFLRRFLLSLGFDENSSVRESLKLDDAWMPTPESQEIIRGRDVLIKTPPADDQGRVFLNNVNSEGSITGVKR